MESVRPQTTKTTPVTGFTTPSSTKPTESYVPAMPFGKSNFQLMIAGIVTILIGFFVMTIDTEPFGFGFLGLTLGPLIVTAGFIIEFFAILKKPTESAN
ncbi:DUF3098 domain-containing protein [Fibrella aquatica]|jgi:Protein of unknown function (DUF3098)|uniref:DUF3098 domain-containing protein n=1 Tax=Fibrella aquatica TaxID=3242487 RepID=UPI00351FFF68